MNMAEKIGGFFGSRNKKKNGWTPESEILIERLEKEQEANLRWVRIYDGDTGRDLEKILSERVEAKKKALVSCLPEDLVRLQSQCILLQGLLQEYQLARNRAIEIEKKLAAIKKTKE